MDLSTLNEVMAGFGRELGVDGFELNEDGYAALVTDSTVVLNFDFYEEEQKLVVMSTVAVIDEKNRVAIYEEMLQGAFFWGENRGVTMALSPDGYHAVTLYAIDAEDMTVQRLLAVHEMMCEHSWAWAMRIANATGREHHEPPEPVRLALEGEGVDAESIEDAAFVEPSMIV